MNLEMFVMFATWIVLGIMAGGLAGIVLKRGGYGLAGDLILGASGSIVGSGIFWALGFSPETGLSAMSAVAIVGAAIVIVAQRQFWHARA